MIHDKQALWPLPAYLEFVPGGIQYKPSSCYTDDGEDGMGADFDDGMTAVGDKIKLERDEGRPPHHSHTDECPHPGVL